MSNLIDDVFRIRIEVLDQIKEFIDKETNLLNTNQFRNFLQLILQTPLYKINRDYGEPPDFSESTNMCIDIIQCDYRVRIEKIKDMINKESHMNLNKFIERNEDEVINIIIGFAKILGMEKLLKVSSEIEKLIIGKL
jgi:hypothetical protein